MVDPENSEKPMPVTVIPKSIIEVIGGDAMRAGPYAALLLFAIWWLNSSWQIDKLSASMLYEMQTKVNAEAVKKQAELTVVAVDKVAVQQTIQLKDLATSYTGQLESQAKTHAQQLTTMERLLTHKSEVNAERIRDIAKKVDEIMPPEGGGSR